VLGDSEVISALNDVLTNELTAINQYFLHARIQGHWGYKRLEKHTYDESIDEMKHADQLVDRILYLGGHPNLQRLHTIRVGENVPEQLESDRSHELTSLEPLRGGVDLSRSKNDFGTAVLLESIIVSEEKHIDWLDHQFDLIEQIGVAEYLSQQIHD
jgi:bacterioferritin